MTTDTSEGEWVGAALVPSATIHQSVNHPRNGAPPSAGTESGPAAVSQVAAAENAPHRRQRRQLRGTVFTSRNRSLRMWMRLTEAGSVGL